MYLSMIDRQPESRNVYNYMGAEKTYSFCGFLKHLHIFEKKIVESF